MGKISIIYILAKINLRYKCVISHSRRPKIHMNKVDLNVFIHFVIKNAVIDRPRRD